MRNLKYLLLLFLGPIGFAQTTIVPPCTSNFTLNNANLTGTTFANSTQSCDKWTLTAYVVGSGSFTLTFQSAPAATNSTPGTFVTYAGTTATGSNPLTATGISTFTNGTVATPYVRVVLNVTGGTVAVYGVIQGSQTVISKGGGGGGGGGGPTIQGTANEIAVAGAGCTTGSTATCTISIPTNPILPGNVSATGTISSGVGSGTTGALDLVAATSGDTSTVAIDDTNPGTVVKLPNDTTAGLYQATSPTATPAAGCAQYSGTGTQLPSTGVPCGTGTGTAGGGVLGYSATALTLPTAGTTFLAPVGGALASTTEANVAANTPAASPISNMYVSLSSAPGTGNTAAFTYRDAGSSTPVTCTIAGATATTCNDTTHTFTPVVGDALAIQVVTTGTVVITPAVKIVAEYGVMGGSGYNTVQNNGVSVTQQAVLNFINGGCVNNGVANSTDCTFSGSVSANQTIRGLGAGFNGGGSAITSGSVTYVTVPFACTITGFNITADTGTISFDVWKIGTGTAIPTIANTIMTGGFLSLSSGTAIHSTSTALFTTTAVSANDIFGFNVHAVSSATNVSLVISCNAT